MDIKGLLLNNLVKFVVLLTLAMALSLSCFNLNGFNSSQPYIAHLLKENQVLGISEHWLSGPELYKMERICSSHSVYAKCNKDLETSPPNRGRGYGGVAIYCDKSLTATPVLGVLSDRIIAVTVGVGNQQLCIINVYMPNSGGEEYDRVIDELLELSVKYNGTHKLLVMGDFNTTFGRRGGPRGSEDCTVRGATFLDSIGANEYDPLLCADMSQKASGCTHTFYRQGIGKSWIDHIFMSASLFECIIACGVIDEHMLNVSDHLPVHVSLSMMNVCNRTSRQDNLVSNTTGTRVKWHKMSADEIKSKYTVATQETFEDLCSLLDSGTENCDVNILATRITDKIVNVTQKNLVTNKCKKSKAKPFWCDELSGKLKIRKQCYDEWKANGGTCDHANPNFVRYKESKRDFRKCYRRCEAKFKASIEDKIDACQDIDQREFWYLLRRDKKTGKHGHVLRDNQGNIVSDPTKVLSMWEDHFSTLGTPSECPSFDNGHKMYVEDQVKLFCNLLEEMALNVLDDPITSEEIENVCKKLKTGKACDFTSLSYENFKYAGTNVYKVLSYLFNKIVQSEVLPDVFKKGITLALFKGGEKDPLDQNNFRGITIQSVLCKIYESVLVNRSSPVIKQKFKLAETQSACSKNLSSIHASLLLQETVAHHVESGSSTYVTFFDTKKAFDTVWIEGLMFMLYVHGIRGKLWRLIRLSYVDCLTAVLLNGNMTRWFKMLQGVKQGAILSMLLYICFINGLIKEVVEFRLSAEILNIQVGAVGYADDIAFICLDNETMQHLIDLAYEYSCKWRFNFSPSKCAVMIFGKNVHADRFRLGNIDLDIVNLYTHVGITLMSKGKVSLSAIKSKIQASKRAFYSLVGTSLYKTSLSPIALSKLYWSICIPKLLAGAEVRCFSRQEYDEYSTFHKTMAKDIQRLPEKSPDPMVLSSLGWRDIVSQIDYMKLMFIQRILALNVHNIYRIVFLRRLFYIILSGNVSAISPVAQIVRVLLKYGKVDEVTQMISSGEVPSKTAWKKQVVSWVNDKMFTNWRFLLTLYSKLELYRIIFPTCGPVCWWQMSKSLPFLKNACVIMMRLLSGTHVLAISKLSTLPRGQRICRFCNDRAVEDVQHFILLCTKWSETRLNMLRTIEMLLPHELLQQWSLLPMEMKMYILLGLEYPFPCEFICAIRYISCVHIQKMYNSRRLLEPP